MTIELRAPRPRKSREVQDRAGIGVIGEIGQTIFSCPVCDRPLALRSRRCPGCGTRFVLGIKAKRAAAFIGVGLLAGLSISLALVATFTIVDRLGREASQAAVIAAVAAQPTAPPASTARPLPTRQAGSIGTTATIPALSRSALRHATAVDERLLASAVVLEAAIADRDLDTFTVAQTLRGLSGEAVFGQQLTMHIGAWSRGAELSAHLAAFYAAIHDTAAEGLEASIRNEPAYRAAAIAMVKVLAGVPAIDAEVRDAAVSAGVDIASRPSPVP